MTPLTKARATGAFWLIVFLAGSIALALPRGPLFDAVNKVATLSYVVVTLLLYELLKPVSRSVALFATVSGLIGCVISLFGLAPVIHVRDLVFFGMQCVLVGYLIFQSTFLPRILGVLMVIAGVGWLTFAWPSFAASLAPFNLIPGMLGEGATLLWLMVKGVDVSRWLQQAHILAQEGRP